MTQLFKLLFITAFLFESCGTGSEKKTTEIPQQPSKIVEEDLVKTSVEKPEIFTDTIEFISYDDNGDYMLFNAKKGKEFYSFINDQNENRSLLHGDICEIQWKKDTIYLAGEGDTPDLADCILFVKKIENGNVSKFRKEYKKKLKYQWHEEIE